VTYYTSLGVKVERVMTDNGSCYLSRDFARACKELGLKHIRTKPYTPKTNGKAERFIQTSLREWAYARAYNTSEERTAELPRWLHRYNWHRPHGSIGSKPLSADSARPRTTCRGSTASEEFPPWLKLIATTRRDGPSIAAIPARRTMLSGRSGRRSAGGRAQIRGTALCRTRSGHRPRIARSRPAPSGGNNRRTRRGQFSVRWSSPGLVDTHARLSSQEDGV